MNDKPPERPSQKSALWDDLRRLTAARIGLARSGASLATGPLLDFRLAHARARDAVHEPLDEARLVADLARLGRPVIVLASAAKDRPTFLMRPDLGRTLSADGEAELQAQATPCDLVVVVADGLSARAVQAHAAPVLAHLVPVLERQAWRIGPLAIVRNGRVAVGDVVARGLKAACVAMLIGERPGLSAPDSLGAYLTWDTGAEITDADRNCVSNIRPDGIGYADAAAKLAYLLSEIRTRRVSGLRIKDESDRRLTASAAGNS